MIIIKLPFGCVKDKENENLIIKQKQKVTGA